MSDRHGFEPARLLSLAAAFCQFGQCPALIAHNIHFSRSWRARAEWSGVEWSIVPNAGGPGTIAATRRSVKPSWTSCGRSRPMPGLTGRTRASRARSASKTSRTPSRLHHHWNLPGLPLQPTRIRPCQILFFHTEIRIGGCCFAVTTESLSSIQGS